MSRTTAKCESIKTNRTSHCLCVLSIQLKLKLKTNNKSQSKNQSKVGAALQGFFSVASAAFFFAALLCSFSRCFYNKTVSRTDQVSSRERVGSG